MDCIHHCFYFLLFEIHHFPMDMLCVQLSKIKMHSDLKHLHHSSVVEGTYLSKSLAPWLLTSIVIIYIYIYIIKVRTNFSKEKKNI